MDYYKEFIEFSKRAFGCLKEFQAHGSKQDVYNLKIEFNMLISIAEEVFKVREDDFMKAVKGT
jgi:hypothetical protein